MSAIRRLDPAEEDHMLNCELTFSGNVGRRAVVFTIGGIAQHAAIVELNEAGRPFVAVYEDCGDEIHVFEDEETAARVVDLMTRPGRTLGDRERLGDFVAQALQRIREDRAEASGLPTTTVEVIKVRGRWNGGATGEGWPVLSVNTEGHATRDACIAALHDKAVRNGVAIVRVMGVN